ncbi:kinase-like protein, partial [Meredithblackwellia eburnea MCA 4105]
GELEVVGRLGEGTYAIVYLVKEILYDPSPYPDELSPIDPSTAFDFSSYSSTPTPKSWADTPSSLPGAGGGGVTYGRNFALKCLCKKDLTDELIEVQRGEAILHRALPEHEFIVRLYGAFETDDWLFLVLEYCPGQDLFFWLQADDSDLYELHSRAASPFQRSSHSPTPNPPSSHSHSHSQAQAIPAASTSSPRPYSHEDETLSRTVTASHPFSDSFSEHTPPSPSLLSSTANNSLLSRKRLRLISRMFGQICSAVQACHDVGISHRDIKPENFIVMDGRDQGGYKGTMSQVQGGKGAAGRVVVKITDWGLGTRETECEDFDCGSKPYMAYECRNNLHPTYDPRQADVWSLGLVLLNLLYHRNPWADPSHSDPDFSAYVIDPVGFFLDRFEGIGEEVATFLSTRVFCDVLEMEGDKLRERVTAGEFGKWASRLVMMMGDSPPAGMVASQNKAHIPEQPIFAPLPPSSVSSRPTSMGLGATSSNPAPSLLSQYAPVSNLSALDDLPADLREELPKVDELEEERSFAAAETPTTESYLPRPFSPSYTDEESLPSPSFPPQQYQPSPPTIPALLPPQTNGSGGANTPSASTETTSSDPSHVDATDVDVDPTTEQAGDDDAGDVRCWGEPETQNPKSKRRKRGARKGRSATTKMADETSPVSSPLSPSSPTLLPTVDEDRERKLTELATASENLARELSKAIPGRPSHHSVSVGTSHSSRTTFGTQSANAALASHSPVAPPTPPSKKSAKSGGGGSGGVFGRMKGLMMDGNQDLNALKQRAQEREASWGAKADTYSAPAKMQASRSSASRSHDVGTSSWGSTRSRGSGFEDTPRGRSGSEQVDHWSSASNRRERQQQQRRRAGDFSPSSSTQNGTLSTSTFDSRNHTPLSSFSSVNSADYSTSQVQASVATVRDWRQPSPHGTRPYTNSNSSSNSRPPRPHDPPTPPSLLSVTKPKLKDASTDTTDLVEGAQTPVAIPSAKSTPVQQTSPLPPPPPPQPASPKTARTSTPTGDAPPSTPSGPVKKNKLGSLLNSISVFNRGQEK